MAISKIIGSGLGATQEGAITFNESGANVDFRVKSDGNANMLFVDGGNNRVGIGTNTPQVGTLHVHTATAGTVTASVQADDLVVESNTEAGITILSPDDQSARIRFSSPSTNTDVGGAFIFYRQNINKVSMGTSVAGGILALSTGAGTEALKIDATGNVTKPKQPAFQVALNANQTNMPTATTAIKFNTERFDVGSNFTPSTGNGQGGDSNNLIGVFTAPVTGKYQLSFHLYLADVDSASAHYEARLVTSNRTYFVPFDPDFGQDASLWSMVFSNLVDMDVNDTASIHLQINSGTAQADINAVSIFSGFLAC